MADTFIVRIYNTIPRKTSAVIKAVHELISLSLQESKELVESNGVVAKGLSKEKAELIKAKLTRVGALVEIVPSGEATPPKPGTHPLSDVAATPGLQLPASLLPSLARHDIHTLEDIRKAGGLSRLEGLPISDDHPAIKTLEAQAYLNLVSEDSQVNSTLIKAGFLNMTEIAGTAKTAFVKKAKEAGVKEETAAAIYARSTAATAYLTNVVTGLRAEAANNFATQPTALQTELQRLFPQQSGECRDCESAVSPLAYLTELLDYTMTHVIHKDNGSGIDLAYLEEQFHQPFGRLPVCCESVERKVRQVRICIEALRGYLKAADVQLPVDYDKKFLFAAYSTLLNAIGTSFEELRLAKTAEPEERKALADRLGISLNKHRSDDELDQLLLTPEQISEQTLEQLFGLVDTTRDPLCDGLKIGDKLQGITSWKLNGVEWNRNTDSDGNIHAVMRCRMEERPPACTVKLYRSTQTINEFLVAEGRASGNSMMLREENNSGLSGRFEIRPGPKARYITLSVIPDFLSWRLQHLRELWHAQDWPDDAFTQGSLPIIDPDLIGPEDFRHPVFGNPAFDLWKTRREWVDDRLEQMHSERQTQGLEHILQQFLGNPLPDFDALLKSLATGENLEEAQDRISNLNLTAESFTRLMEIRTKHIQAEKDSEQEDVSDEEWEELYSILIQTLKEQQYAAWKDEEQETAFMFGPKHFWIALRAIEEGVWSPILHAQRPLIDPELVEFDDLAAEPVGQAACNTWKERQGMLEGARQAISDAYTNGKLEDALVQALGEPPSGGTWSTFIVQIDRNLEDLDEAIRETAQQQVHNQFCMSLEDFNHLVIIQTKEEDSEQEPSEEELDRLYTMLTSSQKRKMLYSTWRQQEEIEDLTYWRVLKTRLPRWRATLERRQQWQQALRIRSQAPVIDPDLITDDDLKIPIESNPASEILKGQTEVEGRKGWIACQISELQKIRESGGSSFGGKGFGQGKFRNPQSIAVDKYGNMYVADSRNNLVQKLDSAGNFLFQLDGRSEGYLDGPGGVAVDDSGNIYVADTGNNRIIKFNADGTSLTQWGSPGRDLGEFQIPTALAVDGNGDVYVVDTRNHRIQKFNPEGKFPEQIGTCGGEDGQLVDPLGVAVDRNGNLYVADTGNSRIQIFDAQGRFCQKWERHGSGEGEFKQPIGVAVDTEGKVYVSDSQNHCIQQFTSEGEFLRQWDEHGDIALKDPRGLAVDEAGNLYAADYGNSLIWKLDSIDGFETILELTIDVPLQNLLNLAEERKQGNDITKRLDQLSLSMEAFSYLIRIHKLLVSGAELMASEWDEVYSILVQVRKRREWAEWRDEERSVGITLCPDFFRMAEETPEDLPPWRASREARWDWEDTLKSRIDQEKNVMAAMAEAVDNCEETTLALLRDALVEACPVENLNIPKAKWLTEQLLIDCQTGSCQKTTRPAQALVTLQNLIFSLRTGQLERSDIELVNDERFDEEWQWIGSYETWKAATGVFLYPENILLPSLRRQQTPAFRELVDNLRTYNRRLTSQMAKYLAKEYEAYLKDICSLSIEEAVQYNYSVGFNLAGQVYIIARGGFTGSLYMSSYDPGSNKSDTQTIWKKIQGMENYEVANVVGAVCHWWDSENKYIFLFLKVRVKDGEYSLILTKYNLVTGSWDNRPQAFDLPEGTYNFNAVVKKGGEDHECPHLAITAYKSQWTPELYARSIVRDDWEGRDRDWSEYLYEQHAPGDFTAMIKAGNRSFILFSRSHYGTYDIIKFRRFNEGEGNAQASPWVTLSNSSDLRDEGHWNGSLPIYDNESIDIYILRSLNNGDTYYQKISVHDDDLSYDLTHKEFYQNIDRAIAVPPSKILEQAERFKVVIYAVREQQDLPLYPVQHVQQYRSVFKIEFNSLVFDLISSKHITPSIRPEFLSLTPFLVEDRQQLIRKIFAYYSNAVSPVLTCLEEVFYFTPIAIALQLQQSGQYIAALDWFRTVYDYTRPLDERKIYYKLKIEEEHEEEYSKPEDWLLDPLNMHEIASNRRNSYTRFILLSIIRCLLAYGDAEFTLDTAESLVKARTLYETALELLELEELGQVIGSTVNSNTLSTKIHEAQIEHYPLTIGEILDTKTATLTEISKTLLKNEPFQKGIEQFIMLTKRAPQFADSFGETPIAVPMQPGTPMHILMIGTFSQFCIPWNPMIRILRLHAENNLYKLRTCRNIAGVKREIEAYAVSTDVLSAMPAIGPGGQLITPMKILPPPVPYRYEFLIERAKQLANMATQMEAAFLSTLEKRDAELYNQLKARQDIQLARAGVRLQNLRLRQAQNEVGLAELQKESAQIQAQMYQEWLDAGLNKWELRMIDAYHKIEEAQINIANINAFLEAAQALTTAATASPFTVGIAFSHALIVGYLANERVGYTERAIRAETTAQVSSIYATYERRAQEWQLQRDLAQQALRIGDQQIKIANDGVNIVQQEGTIARMQVEHAEAIVEFLESKFTNVELYDWMSGVLEGVYSFFLQHATAMAKLAQSQLAFERQQLPPTYIQDDYWEVPSENQIGGASEDAVDRHGLTGSARLMADIYKLDQYRLETEQRKLQLTKIISLAHTAPFEFQRFKETGVMVFATPMDLFDRDFPGHYLRMIKQVRTSVIALIPPTQGIKATLASIGISRLVVNNNGLFQTITAHRPPESMALSSPSNATGLFELQTQSEMLLPFEALGVDTAWEFRMPKAANLFDYSTIADILIAIDYTALDSYDYRQQMIESLRSTISAERPFSFRHQFVDQWYDLHNPEQSNTPMTVRFTTRREDFPPNIERLAIDHVLLYFARAPKAEFEVPATLHFTPANGTVALGGEAISVDGVISTRRGNAGSWTFITGAPVGEWELSLPNSEEIRNRFKNEEIEDILFVISYSGRTPAWPE